MSGVHNRIIILLLNLSNRNFSYSSEVPFSSAETPPPLPTPIKNQLIIRTEPLYVNLG
jgi:hypothetical protein